MAAVVAVAALLLFALGLTAGRAHSEDNRVGLVVQYGDGSVFMGCYPWTADTTGESLLRRAGLNVEADYGSGMGALICRIGSDGCPASDCLCQAQTPPLKYWAYWRLDRSRGDWVYSQQGSSNRALQPGEVDGWAWGVGSVALGAKPPKVTFEQVCPAPTNTPPPTLTSTITPAPSATRTPPSAPPTSIAPPTPRYLPTSTPLPTSTTAAAPAPIATSTAAPAAAAADVPTATPPPTDTPIAASAAALPTAASVALAAAPDIALPSPTSSPAAVPQASPIGAAEPTATVVSQGPVSASVATPTPSRAGPETRPYSPTPSGSRLGAAPPRAPAATPTPGRGGSETRPDGPAPAGATVDLSRLTPVVAGANRGAVEGLNSQAPVGYIAFFGLVAGLGAVLWLRRRRDV